ncbi:MAG: tRNA pseudouridine(55) synthase TruB [Bacteroidales bacterium]
MIEKDPSSDINSLDELIAGKILLIDKPLFWTSFDVVKKIRNQIAFRYRQKTGEKRNIKVGHAGTLDPLAHGLMLLGTGKSTKRLSSLHQNDKEYIASIEIGKTTPSYDLETMFDHVYSLKNRIEKSKLEEVLESFKGESEQIPPVYSAKNIKGRRAYEAARQGEEIKMNPVTVRIDEIELLEYYHPVIAIRVACSKGTYIRSLARDIGVALRTGGHLIGLRRIRIGEYHVNQSISINKFEKIISCL